MTAFSSTGQSLPVVIEVVGEGGISSSFSLPSFVYILIAVVGLIWLSALLLLYRNDIEFSSIIGKIRESNDDIIDAELID